MSSPSSPTHTHETLRRAVAVEGHQVSRRPDSTIARALSGSCTRESYCPLPSQPCLHGTPRSTSSLGSPRCASSSRRVTSPRSRRTRSSTPPTPRSSAAEASTEQSTAPAGRASSRSHNASAAARRATPRRLRRGTSPARMVIHAVGPVWRAGSRARTNSWPRAPPVARGRLRGRLGTQVAFPAISTGVYRFRRSCCPDRDRNDGRLPRRNPELERVTFVLFSEEHLRAFEQALEEITPR